MNVSSVHAVGTVRLKVFKLLGCEALRAGSEYQSHCNQL